MSRLTQESAAEVIDYNRQVLYDVPRKYKYLRQYLSDEELHDTVLRIYKFVSKLTTIIDHHQYLFFLSNRYLTVAIRKKMSAFSSSSRRLGLLCALGLFRKRRQNRDETESLLDVNKNFLIDKPAVIKPINVFSFRKYTSQELKAMDEKAKRLIAAGVTKTNCSYNMLCLHGCKDIADEAYPNNERKAPGKKVRDYRELLAFMEMVIDQQGCTTKQQIKDNLAISDSEIDMMLNQLFKEHNRSLYLYKRPNKAEKERYGLTDNKYIFIRKEKE